MPAAIEAPRRRPLDSLASVLTRPPDHFPWFARKQTDRRALELPAQAAPDPEIGAPAPGTRVDRAPGIRVNYVPGPRVDDAAGTALVARRTPGDAPATGTAPARGGLVRRTPGRHLAELAQVPPPQQRGPARRRDADAEREELDDFLDGLERARPTTPNTGEAR